MLITIYLTKYQFTNLKIPNTSVMPKFFCSFSNKLSTLFIIWKIEQSKEVVIEFVHTKKKQLRKTQKKKFQSLKFGLRIGFKLLLKS